MSKRNWRDEPATSRQRGKIFSQGGDGNRPRTKGEASDMINRGGSGCLVLILPAITAALSGLGYFTYKFLIS
jgi:hypothetical protein